MRSSPGSPASRATADAARTRCTARTTTGLLAVETDPDARLELFDLTVSWHELEYGAGVMIAPARRPVFVERHRWQDPVASSRSSGRPRMS